MKKLIIAITAIAFIGIGGSPAFAQTAPEPTVRPGVTIPEDLAVECAESDGRVDTDGDGVSDACVDFYTALGQAGPTTTVPAASTTTTTIVKSAGPLPSTGSGVSPILGMGALLFVGGGIIVVATRRRSTATAS